MNEEQILRLIKKTIADPEAELCHVVLLLNEIRDALLLKLLGDKEALPTEEISLKIVNYLRSRGFPVNRG